MDARVARLEAFTGELGQAVESLVEALLAVKNDEVQALRGKVAELEQTLSLERSNRELAEVSRMHPKERSVVFVGSTYFGDNIKYGWLAARRAAADRGFACWFLPHDAAQEALVRELGAPCFPHRAAHWSADDLHTALAAAVVVTSDHLLSTNPYAAALLAGARQVQLWHGVSIKEIGLRNLAPLKHMSPHFARVLRTCGHYARFVGTAATAEAEWRRWFAFERYTAAGYARCDVLHRTPGSDDLLNVDTAAYERALATRARGRKVVLYAPTFRDANRGRWLLDAGLPRVAEAVAKNGDLLIVNLHPVEAPLVGELAPHLPGVVFVAPRTDVYPLLGQADALVTDYSSILFDYLHLDRPIVLFRPDHADYTGRSRKLFDDKLRTPPGPVAATAQALAGHLREALSGGPGRHGAERRALREACYDHHDGRSAERLLDVIDAELALALPCAEAA